MIDAAAAAFLVTGGLFFLAGTVGLLRFPDVLTRIHALTKADNLGLGFTVLALALLAEGWLVRAKLLLVWLLVLGATATTGHLIARSALADARYRAASDAARDDAAAAASDGGGGAP
jgi:multicomponent Na+:H+ antiporter subunit G